MCTSSMPAQPWAVWSTNQPDSSSGCSAPMRAPTTGWSTKPAYVLSEIASGPACHVAARALGAASMTSADTSRNTKKTRMRVGQGYSGAMLHADQVGTLLRPPPLLAAREAAATGSLSREALREQEDAAILRALEGQRKVGLAIFTDGEFRRGSWITDMAEAVEGFVPRSRN